MTRFAILFGIFQISSAFLIQPPLQRSLVLRSASIHNPRTTPPDNLTKFEPQIREQQQQLRLNLPPRNKKLTKLEREFREKLSAFAGYSDDHIASIPNPRLRALYEGVAASAHDAAVYRAFEVLFEDLAPLRVAGRVIFGKLAKNMDEQYKRRNELVRQTGLTKEEFDLCRSLLDGVFGSEHRYLSKSQIESIATLVQENLGDNLNLPRGRVSQETILVSLAQQTTEPSTILLQLESEQQRMGTKSVSRFEHRYNEMVHSFSQWENCIPQGEGRRLDVLKGCFVGAKNAKVLEALKIVYVDYAALRFAGDLIFKLVSSIMHTRGGGAIRD